MPNDNPGYKSPKRPEGPLVILDAEWTFGSKDSDFYIDNDELRNTIIKWNPKFMYSSEDPVLEDYKDIYKTYQEKTLRGKTVTFNVLRHDVDGIEVLEYRPDPFFGHGVTSYLTKKECPKLQEMIKELYSKYGKRAKHFSFFSDIKDQLSDAPVGVKKAFNEVVNYFSNPFGKISPDEAFDEFVGATPGEIKKLSPERAKSYLEDAEARAEALLKMIKELKK